MARKISSRLKINGSLQAETPLHVGGYGVDVDTDLPLARNGNGDLYIPGTSLTGVLRAWCEKNFGNVDSIFGCQVGDKGHASFVLIEDVKVAAAKNILTEIRDGVGIDRFYGTAAEGAKYDRAILPKGTKLDFEMIVEIEYRKLKPKDKRKHDKDYDETEDQFKNRIKETKAIFGHLLEALQNQEIRFGASKTRGLGKVKLFKLHKIQVQDFNDILSWITLDGKGEEITDKDKIKAEIATLGLDGISKNDSAKLEITICWHPTLPLMNKAGYEGIGVDMLPVTSSVADGKLSLVLAGSSIKGAFRSQAERIVRTLLDIKTPNKFDDSQNFSKQIRLLDKNGKNTETATKLIGQMFGAKKEKDKPNQPKSKLGLGALSIDDCYSVEVFNQTEWQNVEQGKVTKTKNGKEVEVSYSEQELWQAIETVQSKMTHQTKIRNPHFHISRHTAIDRFTGGVADGALYSVLAPHNIEWQPIKMSLDFGRTDGNDKCCLMLILLVLRDLAKNRLPLGFAINRGMGEIEVGKIEIKGSHNIVWENGQFFFADESQKTTIGKDWQEFIKPFQNQLVSENTEEIMPEKQNLEEQETLIFDSEKRTKDEIEDIFLQEENSKLDAESKYFSTKRDAYKLSGEIYNNKYELEEYAGCGGMGAVYRAKDLINKRQVAIKIIKPDKVYEEPFLLGKFLEEVNNTMKLSHPNIIRAIDSGETEDGTTYMVLEWLEGQTLHDVIEVEKLSVIQISKIFTQICLGIAEAHRNEIIHLDIKPKNIFWFNDDDVKVIDFGLSKAIDESMSGVLLTTLIGTKEYCAPERFHKNIKCTKRTDIYSLGVVLYRLCSGNLDPFDDNYNELKRDHEKLLPSLPSLSDVEVELSIFDLIIDKAIQRNPLDRYDSVEELLKDFETALSKMEVTEGEKQSEQE